MFVQNWRKVPLSHCKWKLNNIFLRFEDNLPCCSQILSCSLCNIQNNLFRLRKHASEKIYSNLVLFTEILLFYVSITSTLYQCPYLTHVNLLFTKAYAHYLRLPTSIKIVTSFIKVSLSLFCKRLLNYTNLWFSVSVR